MCHHPLESCALTPQRAGSVLRIASRAGGAGLAPPAAAVGGHRQAAPRAAPGCSRGSRGACTAALGTVQKLARAQRRCPAAAGTERPRRADGAAAGRREGPRTPGIAGATQAPCRVAQDARQRVCLLATPCTACRGHGSVGSGREQATRCLGTGNGKGREEAQVSVFACSRLL